MSSYPLRPLAEALTPCNNDVAVEPTTEYRTAGIFSFGKGLFAREPILGAETSYTKLTPLRENQLVFGRLNAWEGGIAVVDNASDGLYVSQEFPVLDINRERAEPAYVAYLCRWPDLWDALMQRSRGLGARTGARRLRVHEERLLEVEVPLPDLDEQRRVAEQLDSLLSRTTAIEDTVRKADDVAWLTSLPALIDAVFASESPVLVPVADLADFIGDVVHPGDDLGDANDFVGLQHIESHSGRRVGSDPVGDEKGRKFRFGPGDVVYGYLRPYLNKVWLADHVGLCSVDQYVLRPRPEVDGELLAYALRSRTTLDQAIELTHSLQLPRLRSGLLASVLVPWVDPSHAKQLGSRLDDISGSVAVAVAARRHQVKVARSLSLAVLNHAFAGLL